MHYGRIVAAAVVAWLAYMLVSPFVNNVLLADLYARHVAVFRPQDQMPLVVGFAGTALGFLVFAYAFAKGYEGGHGAMEGLRFGVVVGLLLSGFAVIWNYVSLPISGALAVAWIADTVAEMALYGAIVGLVYRGDGRRRQGTGR